MMSAQPPAGVAAAAAAAPFAGASNTGTANDPVHVVMHEAGASSGEPVLARRRRPGMR